MVRSSNQGTGRNTGDYLPDPSKRLKSFRATPDDERLEWFRQNADSIHVNVYAILREFFHFPQYEAYFNGSMKLIIALSGYFLSDKQFSRWIELLQYAIGSIEDSDDPDTLRQIGDLLRQLGHMHSIIGNLDEAEQAYNALLGYANQLNDPKMEVQAYVGLVNVATKSTTKSFNQFIKSGLIDLMQRISDDKMKSQLYHALSKLSYYEGRFDKSVDLGHISYNMSRNARDYIGMGLIAISLGVTYTRDRNYDQAIWWFDAAQKTLDEHGYKWATAHIPFERGVMYIQQGDYYNAWVEMNESYTIARELNVDYLIHSAAHGLAVAIILYYSALDDHDPDPDPDNGLHDGDREYHLERAKLLAEMAQRYYMAREDYHNIVHTGHTLAYLEYLRGNYEEALRLSETAYSLAGKIPSLEPTFKIMGKLRKLKKAILRKLD